MATPSASATKRNALISDRGVSKRNSNYSVSKSLPNTIHESSLNSEQRPADRVDMLINVRMHGRDESIMPTEQTKKRLDAFRYQANSYSLHSAEMNPISDDHTVHLTSPAISSAPSPLNDGSINYAEEKGERYDDKIGNFSSADSEALQVKEAEMDDPANTEDEILPPWLSGQAQTDPYCVHKQGVGNISTSFKSDFWRVPAKSFKQYGQSFADEEIELEASCCNDSEAIDSCFYRDTLGHHGENMPLFDIDDPRECSQTITSGTMDTVIIEPQEYKMCNEDVSEDEFPMNEDDMEDIIDIPLSSFHSSSESLSMSSYSNIPHPNIGFVPNLQYSEPLPRECTSSGHVMDLEFGIDNHPKDDPNGWHSLKRSTSTGSSLASRPDDFKNSCTIIRDADEENYLDDDCPEISQLVAQVSQRDHSSPGAPLHDTSPNIGLQWNAPREYIPLTQRKSSALTKPISSPQSQSLPSRVTELKKQTASETIITKTKAKPFVRPPFHRPLLSRSPIIGLAPSPLFITCFRIGEALNAAAIASRSKMEAFIEVYAFVTSSYREGVKQHFEFADLFQTDKPPFLSGCYCGWKGVDLFEQDSVVFLKDGPGGGVNGKEKIARAVGIMKRDVGLHWTLNILSVWEVCWEDIEFVRGIICA